MLSLGPGLFADLVARPGGGFATIDVDGVEILDANLARVSRVAIDGAVAVAFGRDGSIDALRNTAGWDLSQYDIAGNLRWSVPMAGASGCSVRPTVVAFPDGGAWAATAGYGSGVDIRVSGQGTITELSTTDWLQLFQGGDRIIVYDSNGLLGAPTL